MSKPVQIKCNCTIPLAQPFLHHPYVVKKKLSIVLWVHVYQIMNNFGLVKDWSMCTSKDTGSLIAAALCNKSLRSGLKVLWRWSQVPPMAKGRGIKLSARECHLLVLLGAPVVLNHGWNPQLMWVLIIHLKNSDRLWKWKVWFFVVHFIYPWSTCSFQGCLKRNWTPLGHYNPTWLRIHLCDFLFQLGESAGCGWERVRALFGIQVWVYIYIYFNIYNIYI